MTAPTPSPSAATPGGVQVGTVLCGKYEIVRELGIGGMSVVWVALDRVLDVEVALKLVERASDSDDFKHRALTEARLAARLVHPAVCRAVDFGLSEDGNPFVVSELLNGESMDRLLEREGRMPAARAVRVLLPILDALEAAHYAGIIHRDVKPANLFLARVGPQRIQPKLLDFGVACLLEDHHRTKASGRICGTPAYMSPEQARGEKGLDGRSDVWGLCATLYELVTGVSPFDGDSCNAVLWAVQTVNPPPITDLGVGDPALAKIIARGLERERSARWDSAGELGRELARWLLSVGEETDATGYSLRARLVDPLHDADEHSALTDPTAVIPSVAARSQPATGPLVRFRRIGVMGAVLVALIGFVHWQVSRAAADRQAIAAVPMAAQAAAPLPVALAAASAPGTNPPAAAITRPADPTPAKTPTEAEAPPGTGSAATRSRPARERSTTAPPAGRAGLPPLASVAPAGRPKPVTAASAQPVRRKSNNALHFDFGL